MGSDPETFTTDPHEDDKAEYEAWKCDLEKREGEISDLMVTSPNIRKNYSSLVPEKVKLVLISIYLGNITYWTLIFFQVTHKNFWTRYFFKVHLIELQENRRQVLKKRAAEVSASKNDEEINWDDVADLAEPSDIPTEMQDKLLNEYEKELKGQKSLKKELNIKENKITPDKGM